MNAVKEKKKLKNKNKTTKNNQNYLILFNDEVNTFDYVIECLVEICEHTYLQAEQAALLAHLKGKCKVKEGTYEYLKPMKDALINAGLSAIISD